MMRGLEIIAPKAGSVEISKKVVRTLGIDLGTTNSVAVEVVLDPTKSDLAIEVLEIEQPTRQGPLISNLVPSMVAQFNGQTWVGEGAKELRSRLTEFGLHKDQNIFWDCKNYMGVRRTFHRGDAGFRNAKDIAGHVLSFLKSASSTDVEQSIENTVVTVPASFQLAQKRDTFDAAGLAGIQLREGGLLDEPIAAFIAYIYSRGRRIFDEIASPKNLLVFDFGGGTCDVAVFRLQPPEYGEPVNISPLSVSRYHRLGGGDIDHAIVLKILLPQLIEQNDLGEFDLDFRQKANHVIPSLLGVAETLKIALCKEVDRLKQFNRWQEERDSLFHQLPSSYPCATSGKPDLVLMNPTMSAKEFEHILKPFLDRDILYPIQTEYSVSCSIFSPINDALSRCKLDNKDIDYCLLVGGSSLIPQLQDVLEQQFTNASLLKFKDAEELQTSIATGAALQALSLSVFGQGLIRPITHDSINIRIAGGQVTLIPEDVDLPYPADGGWAINESLKVPQSAVEKDIRLRVEIQDSRKTLLARDTWTISPIVNWGAPLQLKYRMDRNHVLHLRMALKDDPDREFHNEIENPLTNVVNPNAKQDEILDLEERLRTQLLSSDRQYELVRRIATLESELGRFEKSLDLLIELNRQKPHMRLLHQMGWICGQLNDFKRQEKFYREAARLDPTSDASLFNLALAQRQYNLLEDALESIEEAIQRRQSGPSLVLKVILLSDLARADNEVDATLKQALNTFGLVRTLDDFELFWFKRGAQLANDVERLEQWRIESERRMQIEEEVPPDGVLPIGPSEIVERK